MTGTADSKFLVYDGDCPLCSRYTRMLKLRESFGPIELVSARSDHPIIGELTRRGFDLDVGIVLVEGDQVHFGAECLTRLALLSTPVGIFNRFSAAVLRSPKMSALAYPILRAGRLLLLRILGRERWRPADST